MAAAKVNVTIEQGVDWDQDLTYNDSSGSPVSLVGYTAKAQIRRAPGAAELYLTMSTANGMIVLGGLAGTLTITVPAAVTAALYFATAVWDLVLTAPTGATIRLLEGKVTLDQAVTV